MGAVTNVVKGAGESRQKKDTPHARAYEKSVGKDYETYMKNVRTEKAVRKTNGGMLSESSRDSATKKLLGG